MREQATRARKGSTSLALLVLFATTQLLAASCQNPGPFGMSEADFRTTLEKRDSAAILALPESSLAATGPAGPAIYYYTGRWLANVLAKGEAPATPSPAPANEETTVPQAAAGEAPSELPEALTVLGQQATQVPAYAGPRLRVRELYSRAFDACTGYLQREAGIALVEATAEDAAGAAAAGREKDAAALWLLVLEDARRFGDRLGPDAKVRRARLDALDALGRSAELVRECAEYRALFPAATSNDDGLLYFEGSAAKRIGMKGWLPALRTILLERPVSPWTRKALAFLSGNSGIPSGAPSPAPVGTQAGEGLSVAELDAAAMRIAVADRDYARAYRLALKAATAIFARDCPRALVADAGKAFLYAGMAKNGLELFSTAFGDYPADKSTVKRSDREREAAWAASYYRARFLRALERHDEATALFGALVPLAPSTTDSDASLWYKLDGAIKSARLAIDKPVKGKAPSASVVKARTETFRRFQLDLLAEASKDWSHPESFNDLADALLRDALALRDWPLLVDYATRLAPRLSATMDARSSYIAGRAIQLGLYVKPEPPKPGAKAAKGGTVKQALPAKPASADGSEAAQAGASGKAALPPEAAAFFRAVASRSGAPTYYRILAHRRLGQDPELLPDPVPEDGDGATAAPDAPVAAEAGNGKAEAGAKGPGEGEAEAFIKGFLDYDLAATAYLEARERFGELDHAALRRLAAGFAGRGDWADSMRLALALGEKKGWKAERADFELIYPRPFLDEVRAIRPRSDLPEYVLFGLVRSESFFRPSAVSDAGAVGLAQLMPSTAADIARRLGMKSYDLTRPADNLRLGAAFFAGLLSSTGNRPMEAMFAYNAGGGTLKRWLAENGDLPDDLLLEALNYEETRQYGRNILQASYFYGILYYGMEWQEAVDGILAER